MLLGSGVGTFVVGEDELVGTTDGINVGVIVAEDMRHNRDKKIIGFITLGCTIWILL